MKKVKVTFVLPKTLQQELKEKVIKDDYDMKGKSRWIAEAVEHLLTNQSWTDLVKLNDEMRGFEKLESVTISQDLKRQIDNAVMSVRKVYPMMEGVQSRIMRTAIVQRILRF